MLQSVLRSPRRSARKHSAALSFSVRSVKRILRSDVKFYSYKLVVAQELLERSHETRIAYSKNILKNVPANALLITSNEAHFCLSGFVNKQNFSY